jgi:hypothetical protein
MRTLGANRLKKGENDMLQDCSANTFRAGRPLAAMLSCALLLPVTAFADEHEDKQKDKEERTVQRVAVGSKRLDF